MFLFDSLGLDGFKVFAVNNQEKVINELLHDFKRCESKSNKRLTLCSMKFCVNTWRKMSQKTKSQLTETAQNLFHLMEQFAKLKNSQCMNIIILENRVQDLLTSDCGPFQLYFYKNLFDPEEKSKILHHQKLTKNTLETLINEIFFLMLMKINILLKSLRKNITCKFFLDNEYIIQKMNNKFIASHGLCLTLVIFIRIIQQKCF